MTKKNVVSLVTNQFPIVKIADVGSQLLATGTMLVKSNNLRKDAREYIDGIEDIMYRMEIGENKEAIVKGLSSQHEAVQLKAMEELEMNTKARLQVALGSWEHFSNRMMPGSY